MALPTATVRQSQLLTHHRGCVSGSATMPSRKFRHQLCVAYFTFAEGNYDP